MTERLAKPVHDRLSEVTARIAQRSRDGRRRYLDRIAAAADSGPRRQKLGCANQAHGFAACGSGDKAMLREGLGANLAIVTAYNDMLSAHQPYERRAAWRRWRAGCRPCATASRKARPAWSSRCFRAR